MIAGGAARWEWSDDMGFLGWIRNRNAAQQQSAANKSQEPRPENAKQMYAREAAQERANRTPLDRMPAEQQAKVDKIKATLEKATQHIERSTETSPTPVDANGGREAVRQNMTAQDKAAPAFSPTSAQAGKTPLEKPVKAPEKPQERPQTVPRPRTSWER
jgi:hypothetical protein